MKIVKHVKCIVPVQNVQIWEHGIPSQFEYTLPQAERQKMTTETVNKHEQRERERERERGGGEREKKEREGESEY